MAALIVEAPGEVGTGRALWNANDANCAGEMRPRQPYSSKATATLAAQLALRGFALDELADRSFAVSRWSLVRLLPDLDAARDFAIQVGAL